MVVIRIVYRYHPAVGSWIVPSSYVHLKDPKWTHFGAQKVSPWFQGVHLDSMINTCCYTYLHTYAMHMCVGMLCNIYIMAYRVHHPGDPDTPPHAQLYLHRIYTCIHIRCTSVHTTHTDVRNPNYLFSPP